MTEEGAISTAFVTGATGLLGSNLVRELLSRGLRVRALVRSRKKAAALLPKSPRLELVEGDMTNVAAFAAHLRGAEIVYHTAAFFRDSLTGGDHWAELERVNVAGTRALIAAAYAAGIRRFLHVSSIGTLAISVPDGSAVNETMRLRPEATKNDYYRSKILADREVERALEEHADLWAAFILPGFMHGPGDAGPTAAGRTILDFVHGKLPGIVDAHFSYVDARDVAFACAEAANKASRGDRFIVAGRTFHMGEVFSMLERITGKPAPRRAVPRIAIALIAILNEAWARLSRRPALLSWSIYRSIRDEGPHGRFDSSHAQRHLGVKFRPIEETLRDSFVWLTGPSSVTSG